MREIFSIGQKVRIIDNCGFSEGVEGTVAFPPKNSFLADEYRGDYFRKMITPKEEITFVWITFDTPEFDEDGDGPYIEAEINIKYPQIIQK